MDGKNAFKSKTVWGIISMAAVYFGGKYGLPETAVTEILNIALDVGFAAGTGIALIGRKLAKEGIRLPFVGGSTTVKVLAVLILPLLLVGCASSPVGDAFGAKEGETPQQKAFRLTGEYVYGAIGTAAVADLVSGSARQAICDAETVAFLAMGDVQRAFSTGDEDLLSTALLTLSRSASALAAQASLQATAVESAPAGGVDPEVLAGIAKGSATIAAMRLYRLSFRQQVAAMQEAGEQPTAAEMEALEAQAADLHARVRAVCEAA